MSDEESPSSSSTSVNIKRARVKKTNANREPKRRKMQLPKLIDNAAWKSRGVSLMACLLPRVASTRARSCHIAQLPAFVLKEIYLMAFPRPDTIKYEYAHRVPFPDGVPKNAFFVVDRMWKFAGLPNQTKSDVCFFAREVTRNPTFIKAEVMAPKTSIIPGTEVRGADYHHYKIETVPAAVVPKARVTIMRNGGVRVTKATKEVLEAHGCSIPDAHSFSMRWKIMYGDDRKVTEHIDHRSDY
jgi:hypothetical protein